METNQVIHVKITHPNYHDVFQFSDSISLGRKPSANEPQHYHLADKNVSRNQLTLRKVDDKSVEITNLSGSVSVHVEVPQSNPILPNAEPRTIKMPLRLRVASTLIEVQEEEIEPNGGGVPSVLPVTKPTVIPSCDLEQLDTNSVLGWFENLLGVLKSAANTESFYDDAAHAIVDSIGLDCGFVMLLSEGCWREASRHSKAGGENARVSMTALKKMCDERATIFLETPSLKDSESYLNVRAFVASPIFNRGGDKIIGALYGVRLNAKSKTIVTQHEAQLAQVLASVVASGISRQSSDQEATRRRIQFEQFVSPEIAAELEKNPAAMRGTDKQITTMFVDLRGFSTFSERLSAENLFAVVRSVMDCLVRCVQDQRGTTCQFTGDGIMAIWNAPLDHQEHATQACLASLAMQAAMPELSKQWFDLLQTNLRIGIGINSGMARVGNTGSTSKPQYGPQGDSVNLASRVEGATKKLGVPILITGETQALLPEGYGTRRLCKVRVVGRGTPVDLYQLHSEKPEPQWIERRDRFEQALESFERGEWDAASQSIFPLIGSQDQRDEPSLILMTRILECLREQPAEFDPVWNFFSK